MNIFRIVLSTFLVLLSAAACSRQEVVVPCDPELATLLPPPPPPPVLPSASRRQTGRVEFLLTVERSGEVTDPGILFSDLRLEGGAPLPRSQYEAVLLAYVRTWTFPEQPHRCVLETGIHYN